MSREYKLNKSELTRLKRQEKLYLQYLPVLKLKLEQLQIEQTRIRKALDEERLKDQNILRELAPYIPCFSDIHAPDISQIVEVEKIAVSLKCVAGIFIKTLTGVDFTKRPLPYFHTPPWLLRARPLVESYVVTKIALTLLENEFALINREFKKSMQKVNLFEIVLIPNTKDAIKRIKVSLSDEQVFSVSRGKVAKGKKMATGQVLELT